MLDHEHIYRMNTDASARIFASLLSRAGYSSEVQGCLVITNANDVEAYNVSDVSLPLPMCCYGCTKTYK